MRLKPWVLVATPITEKSVLSKEIANQFNEKPERYMFKFTAFNAVRYYEQVLSIPVQFWIRRIEDVENDKSLDRA